MRPEIVSHQEICDRMLNVYARVLGSAYDSVDTRDDSITLQRINLIRRLRDHPVLSRRHLSDSDIWQFFTTLQDLSAMSLATGTSVLSVGDLSHLGSEGTRRECLLRRDDSQVRDWHFSSLVQASATLAGHSKLRDLRFLPEFDGIKKCDYRLEDDDKTVELLECKRVHPHPAVSEVSFEALDQKLYEKVRGAETQLVKTAEVLDEDVSWKHALIDLSAYWRALGLAPRQEYGATIQGLDRDLMDRLGQSSLDCLPSVDKLTLSWSVLISVEDLPLALVQSSSCYSRDASCQDGFSYNGWAVAAYPLQSRGPEYRELRVSSVARTISWIANTYTNLTNREAGGTCWSELGSTRSLDG